MADSAKFTVDLVDDVSKPAKKAGNSMKALTKEMVKFDKNTGKWRKRKGMGGAGQFVSPRDLKSLGLANKKTQTLIGSLKKMAVAYGALKVAQLGMRAGMATMGRITHNDSSVFALDRLTHGKGREAFAEIGGMAAKLGLDIDDARHSYANFLKLQFKDTEAKKLLALGADMQALGNSADDVQGIFRAIGQIKSKGRLQAEEMLQLAERGVSQELVVEAIAQQRGITGTDLEIKTQVLALQQQGQVTAAEFMTAFEKAINKKLGQSKIGESAGKFVEGTIAGQWARIKGTALATFDELSLLAAKGIGDGLGKAFRAMEKFFKSSDGEKFLASVGRGFENLGKFAEAGLPLLVDGLSELASGFTEGLGVGDDFFSKIDSSSTESLADSIKTRLIPQLNTLGKSLGSIANAVVSIANAIGALSNTGGFIGSLLLGPNEQEKKMIMSQFEGKSSGGGDPTTFSGWWQNLTGGKEQNYEAGVNTGKGFAAGIQSQAEAARAAGAALGAAAKDGTETTLDIHSPSRVMRGLGADTAAGFQIGMEDNVPDIGKTLALPNVSPMGGSPGGPVSVGDIVINVTGAGNPEETARAVGVEFQRNMDRWLTQTSGEMGAV